MTSRMKNVREYYRPSNAHEAVALKREWGERAAYLGGGSDLLIHKPVQVEAMIDIRHTGMGEISQHGDKTSIGGGALLRDAEASVDHLADGMLTDSFRHTAPWLIRNMATVAGNIANASPAADAVVGLLAMDAGLVLLGVAEELVPLESVLLGPHSTSLGDRLITAIEVPHKDGHRGAFIKLARSASDLAQVNVAVTAVITERTLSDVRVVIGAASPVPTRSAAAESLLEGQEPRVELLRRVQNAVCGDVSPISDWRASADYRRRTSGILVRRAVMAIARMESGEQ